MRFIVCIEETPLITCLCRSSHILFHWTSIFWMRFLALLILFCFVSHFHIIFYLFRSSFFNPRLRLSFCFIIMILSLDFALSYHISSEIVVFFIFLRAWNKWHQPSFKMTWPIFSILENNSLISRALFGLKSKLYLILDDNNNKNAYIITSCSHSILLFAFQYFFSFTEKKFYVVLNSASKKRWKKSLRIQMQKIRYRTPNANYT